MKSYLSSQLEVIAALNGSLSKLIVPVKPQPTDGIIQRMKDRHGNDSQQYAVGFGLEPDNAWRYKSIRPPYPPESLIYFREAIADDGFNGPLFPYYVADKVAVECDFKAKIWDRVGDKPYKISAQQMPEEAARIYAKLGEPIVKRVQEVTEAEAIGYGVMKLEFGYRDYLYNYGAEDAGPREVTAAESFVSLWKKRHPGIEWLWIYPVTVISTTGKP